MPLGSTALVFVFCVGSLAAAEDVTKTIKDLYAASRTTLRDARTRDDLERVFSTLAPEWVGSMPAGETLTIADLRKEAESALAIAPDKRPLPQLDFVYIRETGWNVLAVYWNSRRIGNRVIGALYRDTWVRTADGWRRIRQEKLFPDRPLVEDGKPVILPSEQ